MSKLQKATVLLYYLARAWCLQTPLQTRTALLHWQNKKLRAQAEYLHHHSPFYTNHKPSRWRLWPRITKAVWLQEFQSLNTVNLSLEQAQTIAQTGQGSPPGLTIGLSSGTSGKPTAFLLNEAEQLQWLAHLLVKIRLGNLFKPQRIALFLRANSQLYTQLNLGPLQVQFFNLMHPLEDHLATLATYNPHILVAPPSVLGVLARRTKLQPARVISVAEILDDLQKNHLHKAWPRAHFDEIYQATEGFLAITCAQGTLHLNEDLLRIEPYWLDKAQIRAHPVIWDFSRRTQPYLNYLHDDVLLWQHTPCTCGSMFQPIKKIEGRHGDVFTLGGQPLFSETIARAILMAAPPADYQFTQTAPTKFTLATIPTSAFTSTKNTILAAIKQQGIKAPAITQIPWPNLPQGQKFRRFQNKIFK